MSTKAARISQGSPAVGDLAPRTDPDASSVGSPEHAFRAALAVNAHECMTADEVAAYLRVNRKTVYEYAGSGVIPCRRIGRRLVFSRSAIVAWLTRQPAPLVPGVVR
jgi:excisionase family DNA binding protein